MKIDCQDILQVFFPVNASAGKMRALLILLAIIILWTFNAQNQAQPVTFIFDQPAESGGLIASILGELVMRYFHPAVLALTFTPVILFYIARAHTAAYLSAAMDIDFRQTQSYLMRCAFSAGKIKTKTDGAGRVAFAVQEEVLHKLGGPAQIQIAPQDILLIETIGSGAFKLAWCQDATQSCICDLDHSQRIVGMLHKSNLFFSIQTPAFIEPIRLALAFPHTISSMKEGFAVMQSISDYDARLLSAVMLSNSPIQHFLDAEVTRFFQVLSKSKQEQMLEIPIQPSRLVPARKQADNSYAQLTQFFKRSRKSLLRPHKRSCYCVASESKLTLLSAPVNANSSQGGLLKELKLHLQREMSSFFNLSTIHITIVK